MEAAATSERSGGGRVQPTEPAIALAVGDRHGVIVRREVRPVSPGDMQFGTGAFPKQDALSPPVRMRRFT